MTTQNTLKKIGHEFALSAISAMGSDTTKQQLVTEFLKPVYATIALEGGKEKTSSDLVSIASTIIDETSKVSKDAKNSALRDFKKRINRGLTALGQEAKQDSVPQIGLKTTGDNIVVQWTDSELYYGKDEEGNTDKDKPMSKAAHTKKYGSDKEEAKDSEAVELEEGEKRIVLNLSSPAMFAGSILDVCKAHGLDAMAVAEAMLGRTKPAINADWFTLPALGMAKTHPNINWETAYSDKGGKLGKADVQAIIDTQAA